MNYDRQIQSITDLVVRITALLGVAETGSRALTAQFEMQIAARNLRVEAKVVQLLKELIQIIRMQNFDTTQKQKELIRKLTESNPKRRERK